MRRSSSLVALSLVSVLAGACGGTSSSSSSSTNAATSSAVAPGSPTAAASEAPSPGGVASPSAAASHASTPIGAPSSTPKPSGGFARSAVVTLADGLRVRSRPRIADDSALLNPLLPADTKLYVLDGPVAASGYDWYEVVPLASSTLPNGWVASAARDGTPWIGSAPSPSCPAMPTTMRALASLGPAVGLHCFAGVPITVEARVIGCNCNIDGSWYEPFWFYLGSGGPNLLVEPETTAVPSDPGDWFALNLDPAGEHPDRLPVGEVVELTGIFDHPAAASCTRTDMDGQPVPTAACRLEFAVTRLLVHGP